MSQVYDTVRIMGIDPGSNFLGVGVLYIDLKTDNIVDIKSVPIDLTKLVKIKPLYRTPLLHRLLLLKHRITKIYNHFLPTHLAMETSFINMKRLGAVIPLTQSITILQTTVSELHPLIHIYNYSPHNIKKSLGFKSQRGKDDKELMYQAVKSNKELNKHISIDKLTEHEIDAIAIAYTHWLELKNHKELLLT